MPPILAQQPAADRREDDRRHPEAHAGSPPAGAEQTSFSWKRETLVDDARATRRYLDGLRETAATPEQRKRGIALLRETARRLRKRQIPDNDAKTADSFDAGSLKPDTKTATPRPHDSGPPPTRKRRKRTPNHKQAADRMAAYA